MAKLPNFEVVSDEMAEVFRAMTGAQRLKIANDLFESARRMIASHLAAEHPDWDQQRIPGGDGAKAVSWSRLKEVLKRRG